MTKYLKFLYLAFGFVFFTACVDNVIDEPPIKDFLELETNATIQDILDIWKVGQILPIEEDLVFDAIVVGDDESGNFYKSIVLQDETGGITVRIEANNIYSVLPQGRKVFVRAQGMYVGDFAGLPQIGFEIIVEDGEESLATIPYTLIGDTDESLLVPSLRDQDIEPKVVGISEFNSSLLNTLVKLEDVQFNISELGLTFANADDPTNGVNRELEDCDGNNIVVRTSDFCDFAGLTLPEGNGDLVGIYTIFGPTQQFTIRSLDDISLDGVRCGEVVVDVPEANATIGDVLELLNEGSLTTITDDLIIDGIVTANDISGNFYNEIVIQDENDAINIQIQDFDLFQKFYLGRRVVVKTKGLFIGDNNGLPQIGSEFNGQVGWISSSAYPSIVFADENAGEITPTTVTIDELQNATFFNKLIKLVDVEFASSSFGNTYADEPNKEALEHNIFNCDGTSIILRSSGYADFASTQLPEGNGTITAIYSVYNGTRQLLVRKVQDVSFNGERCDGGGNPGVLESLSEDFQSVGSDQDVSLSGWTNVAPVGVRYWRGKEFSGNTYVQATAFQDDEPSMETWLITPKVKMNGNNVLNFMSAQAFHNHDGLTVFISSDFDGDVSTSTWNELNVELAGSSDANYDWVDSGNIDLSSYDGEEIVIGFKYEGEGSGGTTSYIIDDVTITK